MCLAIVVSPNGLPVETQLLHLHIGLHLGLLALQKKMSNLSQSLFSKNKSSNLHLERCTSLAGGSLSLELLRTPSCVGPVHVSAQSARRNKGECLQLPFP